MANRLTRVPAATPPIDRVQLRLLPVVDTVMALMWSRPGGLSLRTAWVTPATIWLCLVVTVLAGLLAVVGIRSGFASSHAVAVLGAVGAFALGAATGTVAAYGIRQRILARRATNPARGR